MKILPVLLLAALGGIPTLAFSQAMFGGDAAHTGVTSDAGPKQLRGVKWTFRAGSRIVSSPAHANGVLYVGSDDRHLYAVDAATGAEKWKFKTESLVRSSPAVMEGAVYFGSYDGMFYCLNAADGTLRWKFATGGERKFEAPGLHGMKPAHQTMPDFWDVYLSSPAVVGERVFFGSGDHHVYALDAKTGELAWKFKTGGVVHSSPAVADGTVYVGSWDTFCYALDAATGKEKWRFKTGEDTQLYNQTGIQSSPAVKDGVVYFGCRDANLYAVDAATGKERWHFSIKPTWINATPAIHDGVVYLGSSIPTLFYAIDASTGQAKYSLPAELIVFSSARIADGFAYFGSFSGTVYALDLQKRSYAWQFQTPARQQDARHVFGKDGQVDFAALGGSDFFEEAASFGQNLMALGSFMSSPTVADGVLFIGSTDGNLYAIH